jgi:exodeoxyribonuclease V beta subunit
LADHDALVLPADAEDAAFEDVEAEEALTGIFAFPKGTKAGTFLHDVLEHLDFTGKDAASRKNLVVEKLAQYGFEAMWQDAIMDMVQKLLSVPLDPGREDFSLSRIANSDRLNELEFYFPLKPVTPADLGKIEMKAGINPTGVSEHLGRLEFAPVRGYMKGFMDLVFRFEDRFYLVDWKSNFLGSNVEDYDRPGMEAAMAESLYTLQYHLYTLALHQYLKVKQRGYDYEKHFGGVYYIFLRGVDPEKGPQFGVFRDRPSKALIEELRDTLIED